MEPWGSTTFWLVSFVVPWGWGLWLRLEFHMGSKSGSRRVVLGTLQPLGLCIWQMHRSKDGILAAITSLKRVGNWSALSVAPSCLEFAPGGVKAILHLKPDYAPKVPTNMARSIVLQPFILLLMCQRNKRSYNYSALLGPFRFMSRRPLSWGKLISCWYALGLLRRAAQLPNKL